MQTLLFWFQTIMCILLILQFLLPIGYRFQAQPTRIMNAGNGPFRFPLRMKSPSQMSSFQSNVFSQNNRSTNRLQLIQNIQNNLNSGSNFFANSPNLMALQGHRLNPSVPLINLNNSGSGPVVLGLDSQAQMNPQNNSFMVRQGVNYPNGFGGGSVQHFAAAQPQSVPMSNVNILLLF